MVSMAGVDPERFLGATGLERPSPEASGGRLPYMRVVEMIELALDMTGDEALGLRWAESSTQRSFGPLSHLLMHCPSLREAMHLLARYFHLFSDRPAYAVLQCGPSLVLHHLPLPGEPARVQRFVSEMVMGGFWRFFRYFDARAKLGPVGFNHAAPVYRDLYERLFDGKVRFDQEHCAFQFDPRLLDVPSPLRDDELRDTLQGLVERRVMRLDHSTPVSQRVLELLGQGATRLPDMESVAKLLHISARTLRRRLAAEGVVYDDLRAQAQYRVAKLRLADPNVPIQEIAYDLGFAHVSTFHRAFKRWSGTTPGAYRSAQLS